MWKYGLMALVLLAAPVTLADDNWYVSFSAGSLSQGDSDNSGNFISDFTTGDGSPAVPNGTVLAAGTSVGWSTEFDNGTSFAFEGGRRYDKGFRLGIELFSASADVDTHGGVTAGGTLIDGVDAAVLTGSATQLGATVGAVVADGRGDISSLGLMFNGYYDFNRDGKFQPFLGLGLGFTDVDVEFNPSNVGIADDGATAFAYQIKAGGTLTFTDKWEGFVEYTLRNSEDIEIDTTLIPATLDIENEQGVIALGARYRF